MSLPTENQISSIRKYIFEYTLVFLMSAVIYLFTMYQNLNNFITDTMSKQQEKMIIVIEKNSSVIQNLSNDKARIYK